MTRQVDGYSGKSLVSENELEMLQGYFPPQGRMLEIGTYHGVTAAQLADLRPEGVIVCVDPFADGPKTMTGDRGRWEENQRANMRLFVGTAQEFAASSFEQKLFDLVFVDGAHDYEHCLADCIAVAPLVASGGALIVHDYCRSSKDTDIYRAVEEFCRQQPWKQVERVNTALALRRIVG